MLYGTLHVSAAAVPNIYQRHLAGAIGTKDLIDFSTVVKFSILNGYTNYLKICKKLRVYLCVCAVHKLTASPLCRNVSIFISRQQ